MLMVLLFVVLLGSTTMGWGQGNKPTADVVLKTNGDELTGKVVEINETEIRFSYAGETLVYAIKKSEILKVTFASGRIEFFNRPSSEPQPANASRPAKAGEEYGQVQDHHNKVAILPFHYLIDKQDAGEEMCYKVQQESFSFLSKHIGELELQDVNTTNALLIKAGVNNNNFRGFTMGEICNILSVEYIIQGTITQNRSSVSSSSSSANSYQSSNNQNNKNNAIGSIFKSSGSSSTYSSSTQNYQTAILMNVFNDKGQNIFSQDHTSFWSTNDAYKVTLQYLLKRIPLYRK
jgi:hypothetical protein